MSVVALFTFMYGQVRAHNFWHNRDIYFPISFSQENCAFQMVQNLNILLPETFEDNFKYMSVVPFSSVIPMVWTQHSSARFVTTSYIGAVNVSVTFFLLHIALKNVRYRFAMIFYSILYKLRKIFLLKLPLPCSNIPI